MGHPQYSGSDDPQSDLLLEAQRTIEVSRRGLRTNTIVVAITCASFAGEAIRAGIMGSFGLLHELMLGSAAVLLGFAWINWRRGARIRMPNEE